MTHEVQPAEPDDCGDILASCVGIRLAKYSVGCHYDRRPFVDVPNFQKTALGGGLVCSCWMGARLYRVLSHSLDRPPRLCSSLRLVCLWSSVYAHVVLACLRRSFTLRCVEKKMPLSNDSSPNVYDSRAKPMKFSLRDLFWLIAVSALAVGWGKAATDRNRFKHDSELYHGIRVTLTEQPHSGITFDDEFVRIESPYGVSGWRLPEDMPNSQAPAQPPPKP